jgi:glycosyltransferase involved in cell wall biosynthesis
MINVLCTSYLAPGAKSGVTTYYKKLCEQFAANDDINITLITVADAPQIGKITAGFLRRFLCFIAAENNKRIMKAYEIKNRILIYSALWKYKKYKFDIIHAQDILSGETAANFFNQVPLLLTCHFNDTPVEEDMLKYSFEEDYKNDLIKKYTEKFSRVNEFIFVSEYASKKTAYLLAENARVKIIPNGVAFSNIANRKKEFQRLIKDLPFSIINTGYIDTRKNQKILIEIAKELIRKGFENFRVIIVGDGPDFKLLNEIINKEKLSGSFHFTGWKNNADAMKHLSEADLYLHTAVNDNCPYAVIEAIANNIPVIGFNVGGMPEILNTDYLFVLNDVTGIASFIIDNKEIFPAIAAKQYELIREKFSLDKQFESLRTVYQNLNVTSGYSDQQKIKNNFSMHTS